MPEDQSTLTKTCTCYAPLTSILITESLKSDMLNQFFCGVSYLNAGDSMFVYSFFVCVHQLMKDQFHFSFS